LRDDYFSSISRAVSLWLIRTTDALLDRLDRNQERTTLSRMDERELQDIGLARTDIGRAMTTDRHRNSV
jgi:uncharacterized protein YjiS (DUF1127 family)